MDVIKAGGDNVSVVTGQVRPTGAAAGRRTVAVIGAGVIGQVYAGRLAAAGHRVWLLARGETFTTLHIDGVRLTKDGTVQRPPVTVVENVTDIPPVDVAYLAVRADQVDAALPILAGFAASVVVTLVNLGADARRVAARIGTDRAVLGFAGVGGRRTGDGVVYHDIDQQHTTLGIVGGHEQGVVEDLRAAGLAVDVVTDMVSWLATHTVFIAGIGAAILQAGGSEELGADRGATARMVLSIRDGFTALAHNGITVAPRPLRIIFTRVPTLISVPYWQRQLRGDLGRLALAPHVTATRDTEFPLIAAAARHLTGNTRRLRAALDAAGLSNETRQPPVGE